MHILITSAGKRVTLVRLFQEEIKTLGLAAKVYTAELNPDMSPAAQVSDGFFKVPPVTSDGYAGILLDICKNNNIGLVVPTIDTELLLLSRQKNIFSQHNIEMLVANEDFISMCRDKRKTHDYMLQKGIRIPKAIDKFNPVFPLFVKPFDGSLSKDAAMIKSADQLTDEMLNHPKLMFMEYIDKNLYKEYSVDMYYGKDNIVKSIVPRERTEVRAGEINKGFARKNYLVSYLLERVSYLPGVVGPVCIQLFYNADNDDVVGIEINPRFAGGYPLTHYARANFISSILKEYFLHEEIQYSENWIDNTLILRYDSEIVKYPESCM